MVLTEFLVTLLNSLGCFAICAIEWMMMNSGAKMRRINRDPIAASDFRFLIRAFHLLPCHFFLGKKTAMAMIIAMMTTITIIDVQSKSGFPFLFPLFIFILAMTLSIGVVTS